MDLNFKCVSNIEGISDIDCQVIVDFEKSKYRQKCMQCAEKGGF